jgi:CRISPR type I-E-associated protein CasB/Cse2
MRPSPAESRFAQLLAGYAHRGPRAVLPTLLHGLGRPPGAVPQLWRWLGPALPGTDPETVARYFLVGSLFALNPHYCHEGNIGTTCAAIRVRKLFGESFERRMTALLAADLEALPGHLRRIISLARETSVSVNWAQLLADLRCWNHGDRFVQMAWAREYWQGAGTCRPGPQRLAPALDR